MSRIRKGDIYHSLYNEYYLIETYDKLNIKIINWNIREQRITTLFTNFDTFLCSLKKQKNIYKFFRNDVSFIKNLKQKKYVNRLRN